MIKVAIVEDNKMYAKQTEKLIEQYGIDKNLSFQIQYFDDGIFFTESFKGGYDIIFLDVMMPLMDGFTAARNIRKVDDSVVILFLTNMSQYAIKGYEVDALDYILKPITYEIFNMKFSKAVKAVMGKSQKSITVSGNGQIRKFKVSDIYYIEVMNHQLCFHTSRGDFSQTGATSLKNMEAELREDGFVKCNQCYLVNLKYVDCMQQDRIWVSNTELKVSRNRKKEFAQALVSWHREMV